MIGNRQLSRIAQRNICSGKFLSLLINSDHDSGAAEFNLLDSEANDNLDIQFVRYVAVNVTGLSHEPVSGPILHWIGTSINFHPPIINFLARFSTPILLSCATMVPQLAFNVLPRQMSEKILIHS